MFVLLFCSCHYAMISEFSTFRTRVNNLVYVNIYPIKCVHHMKSYTVVYLLYITLKNYRKWMNSNSKVYQATSIACNFVGNRFLVWMFTFVFWVCLYRISKNEGGKWRWNDLDSVWNMYQTLFILSILLPY